MDATNANKRCVSMVWCHAIIAAFLIFSGTTLYAHHSSAMFDDKKVMELSGTVKEFQWTNPHTWIQIEVENSGGELEEWSIEAGGPNSLSRRGWRPSTFKPGDVVVFRVHPARKNVLAGDFIGAKFSDGSTLGDWGDDQTAPQDEQANE